MEPSWKPPSDSNPQLRSSPKRRDFFKTSRVLFLVLPLKNNIFSGKMWISKRNCKRTNWYFHNLKPHFHIKSYVLYHNRMKKICLITDISIDNDYHYSLTLVMLIWISTNSISCKSFIISGNEMVTIDSYYHNWDYDEIIIKNLYWKRVCSFDISMLNLCFFDKTV